MTEKPRKGSKLPEGTTRWSISYVSRDGESWVLITFYDDEGNVLHSGEYGA